LGIYGLQTLGLKTATKAAANWNENLQNREDFGVSRKDNRKDRLICFLISKFTFSSMFPPKVARV